MSSFSIRTRREDNRLTIHVVSGGRVTGSPIKDRVDAIINLRAGGFDGRYQAQFLTQDISQLYGDLKTLYNNLSGSLNFQTLESQLEIEIIGDGFGHFQTRCTILDEFSRKNSLYFPLAEFDQTYIPQMLRELSEIISMISPLRH